MSSDLRNVDTWVPPHGWLPVRSHQKLFKVPLDVVELHRLPEQSVFGVAEAVSNRRARVLGSRRHKIITSSEQSPSYRCLSVEDQLLIY